MAKANRLQEIEEERGEALTALIPRLLNEFGTMEAVAEHLGVHFNTIYRWCDLHGVERKVTYVLPEGANAIS